MNVSLTPDLERFVREKVESGLYNSASEVVREALRLLVKHDHESDWSQESPGYLERSPERLEQLRRAADEQSEG